MTKLLSIAVPCYQSEAYMRRAVESLLPGGDEVEILIVDDGSRDGTAAIADEYAARYPDLVRAVHKENGGHGDAVMCGLSHASGLYFKVVDSDDWVDAEAYPKVLRALSRLREEPVDLFVCDYVYDKVGQADKHVVRYANALPVGRAFGWEETRRFRPGQYILMHSAIYRTAMLRECGLSVPKHTFYVDNLYVYVPMTRVKRMFYLDEVLYHYFIGRDDQSVHEEVMIQRIDQQLRVNRLMLSGVDVLSAGPKQKRRYMLSYLEIITAVSSVLLIRSGTARHLEAKKALWREIRRAYPRVWLRLRLRPIGMFLHLPGRAGRRMIILGYEKAQKRYGFN